MSDSENSKEKLLKIIGQLDEEVMRDSEGELFSVVKTTAVIKALSEIWDLKS